MPHLSPAATVGEFTFLSGQIAFDDSGNVTGDIVVQTRRCLERLETVLKVHGLDRSAIVKTNVWIVNRSDFARFDRTYAEFFGERRPARSTVVSDLALDTALIEIDAIAFSPSSQRGADWANGADGDERATSGSAPPEVDR